MYVCMFLTGFQFDENFVNPEQNFTGTKSNFKTRFEFQSRMRLLCYTIVKACRSSDTIEIKQGQKLSIRT